MNPARVAREQSRAILLLTSLLVAAGIFAYLALPSSIYPPLEFPRIVVIAHSGSTPARSMMLRVARPLEQAIMEVPGIRRVRSRSFRGATEISAQFEPGPTRSSRCSRSRTVSPRSPVSCRWTRRSRSNG